ncbi:MAG TPA: hypothetical protein VL856_00995 [Acidimicrobiia bacterium]|jgi:hypothetical protein|nr:hypothetical protein [Acidimicrobiia bacterium]
MLTRTWVLPVCIALCALAVVFIVVGFVYLLVPAAHLPSFLPGQLHAPRLVRYKVHRVSHPYRKRALLAFALAAVPLVGAWWLRFRYDPPD